MNRARLAVLLAGAMIAAAIGVPRLDRAGADGGAAVCNPGGACVLLIEVDGLEAKDVTPQTTPFLWALGHSGNGVGNVAANTNASPVAVGAAQVPGIAGRNGFIWQAARGVMSASTAASTMSLLTGGYPGQTDVPADNYVSNNARFELGGRPGDDNVKPVGADASASTLLSLMKEAESDPAASAGQGAAIMGDPRLARVFGNVGSESGGDVDSSRFWAPGTSDSVPAYCPIPQDAAEAQGEGANVACPTPDANTIKHAGDILTGADGAKVSFSYVELAELGAVKRLYGDVDDSTVPAQQNASSAVGPQHVASQLAATDAAIGSLIARVEGQGDKAKWDKTVVMVVGNHGYETTPQTHRVPDPQDENNLGMGLEDYVANVSGHSASFVPDGNIGFVYAPNDKSKLGDIANDLKPGGPVDQTRLCNAGSQAAVTATVTVGSGCIQEVLATGAVDAGGHSTIPGIDSVQDKHPDWHLHYVDPTTGAPSGSDGDLMVVLKPGWAAGELVPIKSTGGLPNPTTAYQGGDGGGSIENPYIGTPGGPRNRAIAAIVNGPQNVVQQVDTDGAYPVAASPLSEDSCPNASGFKAASIADPNADPSDDAIAPGYECQAETVDFAPTIGALLHLGVPFTQIGGRFLQEAFKIQLGLPQDEEVAPALPDDALPPPLEPDVRIPNPPPPPKGFDFFGLLRDVSARVVDSNGCTWETARPGAHMDFLRIEGDFGRQLSSAQLTFYQRKNSPAAAPAKAHHTTRAHASAKSKCLSGHGSHKARAAKAAKRPPLRAIARFKPFALKRGHVVLRLRIPDLYRPSHVGIFVQEARRVKVPSVGADGQPGPTFQGFGPAAGQIVVVGDARHLHAVKPGGAKTGAKKGKHRGRKGKRTRG